MRKLRKTVSIAAIGLLGLLVLGLLTALILIALPPPAMERPRNVFDFASLKRGPPSADLPVLMRYPARDGELLPYRFYDSKAERILIFIHSSSYHGAGYHGLANRISAAGAAKVVLPNLRGHYMSGPRPGDVDYIGQFEDDIADLIKHLRADNQTGPITLGGHSSGGGFGIRFAGGEYRKTVDSFLLLAPVIPASPAVRHGDAGGWANLNRRRLFGLIALNAVGIHAFDSLHVIDFNKPEDLRDGTETLAYSYRLNVSYHPRFRYQADLRALGDRALVMIGQDDEAVDPVVLKSVIAADAPVARFEALPAVNHFGIFRESAALDMMAAWLSALPSAPPPGK